MNAIVQFQPPRLPYHPIVEERFGVDKTAWKALVEAVFPSAKTPDAVVMALAYCKRRQLDVFKRPVHIVPIWDSAKGGYVETVWPGISELRTTAMRTGLYAGCEPTEFGPEITREFVWQDKKGGGKATVVFPEWAMITVYRMVGSTRVPVPGPKVYWTENCATRGKSDAPNDMWIKRPRGQLEKCAEAAALRRAFPEELGNEYAAEEMEGKTLDAVAAVQSQRSETQRLETGFSEASDPARATAPAHDPDTGEVVDAEFSEAEPTATVGVEALGDDAVPDFPGDRPSSTDPLAAGKAKTAEVIERTNAAAPTLAERVATVKGRIAEAPTVAALERVKNAAKSLRADLDARDPEALADLDAVFDAREAVLAEGEGA